tara:strand:- start:275 stop:463 length:189 start_codon:yes stop_codon:yes gene_type:complete
MTDQSKLDIIANLWNKTKNPKYKNLWYELIKEFTNGSYNIKRRPVSTYPSNKENVRGDRTDK